MKRVHYFLLRSCPYCHQADKLLEALMQDNPRYRDIPIERIDEREQADLAARYDYYYVPTFFVGGQKLMEGPPTMEAVKRTLDEALR